MHERRGGSRLNWRDLVGCWSVVVGRQERRGGSRDF
jgi:hypothetical protein